MPLWACASRGLSDPIGRPEHTGKLSRDEESRKPDDEETHMETPGSLAERLRNSEKRAAVNDPACNVTERGSMVMTILPGNPTNGEAPGPRP